MLNRNEELRDFHNYSYIPKYNMTETETGVEYSSLLTDTSSNILGKWYRLRIKSGTTSGDKVSDHLEPVNEGGHGEDFYDANTNIIKSGTYLLDITLITSINPENGKLWCGIDHTTVQGWPEDYIPCYRYSSDRFVYKVIRIDEDTQFMFNNSVPDAGGNAGNALEEILISSFREPDSVVANFNKLHYIPNDEDDGPMSCAVGMTLVGADYGFIGSRQYALEIENTGVLPGVEGYKTLPTNYNNTIDGVWMSLVCRVDSDGDTFFEKVYGGSQYYEETPHKDNRYVGAMLSRWSGSSTEAVSFEGYAVRLGNGVNSTSPYTRTDIGNVPYFMPTHRKNVIKLANQVATIDRRDITDAVLFAFNPTWATYEKGYNNFTGLGYYRSVMIDVILPDEDPMSSREVVLRTADYSGTKVIKVNKRQGRVMLGTGSLGYSTIEMSDGGAIGPIFLTLTFLA